MFNNNFNYENEDELENKREQKQNEIKSTLSRRKKQKKEKKQIQRLLDKYYEQTNHYGLVSLASQEREKKKQNKLKRFEEQTPKFSQAGASSSLRYIIIILGLIIVVTFNFLLIHAPVEYLASMAFEEGSWQMKITTLIVPVCLLLLEIYISINLYEAKLGYYQLGGNEDFEEAQEEIDKQVRRWELAGKVMIAFTPLMILGTMFAREDWYLPYNLLTTLGLMVLALVTDAAIVFSGKLIKESLDFLWFQITIFRLESTMYYWENKYRKSSQVCIKNYHLYQRTHQEYNQKYPDDKLIVCEFSYQVEVFIQEWMQKGKEHKK
jgi:hypothetical protein